MNDKKYYILEKLARYFKLTKMPNGEFMFMEDDYVFDVPNSQNQFTKNEIAEIKDGMFLKRIPGGTPLDDLGKDKSCYVWLDDCNYWKNPFIELVPLEDGE
ncbi:hypothetical protein B9W73_09540 [Lactococcus lactis]|uniref:hypothetical protein n=1 Tax=Lactococcus lactis TaxID=1358 RepID=UPI000A1EDFDB|nr:hypothetical protein [Lactococcus lactis]OSP86499.1 hypothetical protein B9W73_09540 [Lactococcus lactis]